MNIKGLKKWQLILTLCTLIPIAFTPARAQSSSGTTYTWLTVTGNTQLTGTSIAAELDVTNLDVLGNTSYFGSLSGTGASVAAGWYQYSDGSSGTGATLTNTLVRPGASWVWQRPDVNNSLFPAMELNAANQLILSGSSLDSSGSIVIDPVAGVISINGQQVLTNADGISVSAGDVGIGTSDPDSPLEVSTDFQDSNAVAIVLSSSAQGNYAANMVLQNSNGTIGNLSALGSGYDMTGLPWAANDIALIAGQDYSTSNLVLSTNGAGSVKFSTGGYGASNERMRITPGGYVGIGTTNPQSIIDVANGGAPGVDTATLRQTNSGSGNLYANLVFANTNGTIANFSALGAGYPAGNIWGANDFVLLGGQGNAATNMLFLTSSSGSIKFGTGGYSPSNERMRITPGGNVGIGTTSPQAPLEVCGTVKVSGSTSGVANAILVNQAGDISMGGFQSGPTPQ